MGRKETGTIGATLSLPTTPIYSSAQDCWFFCLPGSFPTILYLPQGLNYYSRALSLEQYPQMACSLPFSFCSHNPFGRGLSLITLFKIPVLLRPFLSFPESFSLFFQKHNRFLMPHCLYVSSIKIQAQGEVFIKLFPLSA